MKSSSTLIICTISWEVTSKRARKAFGRNLVKLEICLSSDPKINSQKVYKISFHTHEVHITYHQIAFSTSILFVFADALTAKAGSALVPRIALAARGERHFKAISLKRFYKEGRFENKLRNILAGFIFFSMVLRLTG